METLSTPKSERKKRAKYLREWREKNRERARIISLRWYYQNKPEILLWNRKEGKEGYKPEVPFQLKDYRLNTFPFPGIMRLLTLTNSDTSTLEMLKPTKTSCVPNIKEMPNLPSMDGLQFFFLGFSS